MAEFLERPLKVRHILWAVKQCDKRGVSALRKPLLGQCSRLWGTAWRTGIEYLNELVANKEIVIEGEDIWTYERWLTFERSKEEGKQAVVDYFKGLDKNGV